MFHFASLIEPNQNLMFSATGPIRGGTSVYSPAKMIIYKHRAYYSTIVGAANVQRGAIRLVIF